MVDSLVRGFGMPQNRARYGENSSCFQPQVDAKVHGNLIGAKTSGMLQTKAQGSSRALMMPIKCAYNGRSGNLCLSLYHRQTYPERTGKTL
jgi:hypothetical protein